MPRTHTRSLPPRVSQIAAIIGLILAIPLIGGCNDDPRDAGPRPSDTRPSSAGQPAGMLPPRGRLISIEPLASLEPGQVRRQLIRGEWGAAPVRAGVAAYRITYETSDLAGEPIHAMGSLAFPTEEVAIPATVVYAHGTQTYNGDSVSSWGDPYAVAPLLAAATQGFATILPDYIGIGGKARHQAWLDTATEAAALTDMVTASRRAAADLGRPLAGPVNVIGFSQGASAVLAATSRMTTLTSAGPSGAAPLGVGRVFAISGAYDFAGSELPALLNGQVDPRYVVPYTSLMLVSWNQRFHLYDDPQEVFSAPYYRRVERLFDGSTPGPVMMSRLPGNLARLLTNRGLQMLQDPTPDLRAAMAQADSVCTWHGRLRIDLYVARDDEQATSDNTQVCAERLRTGGNTAVITDLGRPSTYGSRHLGTNVIGTLRALKEIAGGHSQN